MCAKATNLVEREQGVPRQLLRAISKIESGRFHPRKQVVMAWPWTVMAEGRGRILASKEAAIAEVEALQARGVSNIDVGCMQINLRYHPDAFRDLDEAFDPIANVAYSARFLKTLVAEHRSWSKAVAYYHSANPDHYRNYRAKVRMAWRSERQKYLAAIEKPVVSQPLDSATAQTASNTMPPIGMAAYANLTDVATADPHHPPIRAAAPARLDPRLEDMRFAHDGPVNPAAEAGQALLESRLPEFGHDGPVS
ncbi:MAG: transglycosylase SLT domain-containing protein [Dongiaceae bacterium]